MRPPVRPLAAVLGLLCALALVLLPGTARADDTDTPTDTPLVLAGVAGLRWSDVDAARTPNLWRLVGGGSVASSSVRTLTPTCPRDAWLSLSAGSRVVTTEQADDERSTDDGTHDRTEDGSEHPEDAQDVTACPRLPVPPTTTVPGRVVVPGWADLTAPADDATATTGTTAAPGALATLADAVGTCTTAVGPGGALALASPGGIVDRYLTDEPDLTAPDVAACPVTVVDLGELPDSAADRGAAVTAVDDAVGRLVGLVPAGGRLVVAGLADTPLGPADLQVVVDWTSPGGDATWLTSTSSRWPGVVVTGDLSATLADALLGGADPEDPEVAEAAAAFTGSPLERGEDRRLSVARTVDNRQYLSVLTDILPRTTPVLVGAMALAVAATAAWVVRSRRRRSGHGTRVAVAVLAVAASVPGAAGLATLTRWWVSDVPVTVLSLAVTTAALVLALGAWWARLLLPRSPWRLPTTLAGTTWLVLTVDGLTGTTLQQGSLLGPAPSLGARFYGFSNTVFAVYAVVGLVLAAGAVAVLRHHGARRRTQVLAASAVGAVTVAVDGLPPFGADLGGIVALVPAFAVLVLGVARTRLTWGRVLLVGGGTLAAVALVAVTDWATGPSTHLGGFVQSVLDGDAVDVVAGKAAGAWATVANPAGAVAAVVCVAVGWAVLDPRRARLPGLAAAYDRDPLLRRTVLALVTLAVVGTLINDSGIVVAGYVVVVATAVLLGGPLEDRLDQGPAGEPGVRRLPTMLVTVSGVLLVVLLLVSTMLTAAGLRSAHDTAAAGAQVAPSLEDAVVADRPVVVVGTTGVRWDDVAAGRTPALHGLLTDGAGAGGVAQPTGAAARCAVGGWTALSAGTLTEVSDHQDADETWVCPTPRPVPAADGSATVDGWDELVALQAGSAYGARLGTLADQLAPGGCATAVGPGAALALADADGDVARYLPLEAATTRGGDTWTCPVTVVDAGDATAGPADPDATDAEDAARDAEHTERVRAVDAVVGAVLAAAPTTSTVLVVDLAGTPGEPPVLGVALARAGTDAPDEPRFLTSTATRTDGVARVLDLPATMLGATGATAAEPLQHTPLLWGSPRPQDAGAAAEGLADLTTLDHSRRAVYSAFVDLPLYAALALAAACLLVGPRLARATGPRAAARRRTALGWARGAALALAALPAGAYLASLTGWWASGRPTLALVASTLGATAVVAATGALVPRRPVWLAPGTVAGITFVVLTLDALVGTPLNRSSPLGSAPTFGARFYGFGNPTFSVYAVAALVVAGALAQLLVNRGRRALAATAVAGVGVVTMVIDVWPTLGADLGGGLVIVPAFAVLGLAASGARLTWRRFTAVAAAGVAVVAVIGVLDWMRPADERSHLGNFVGQVLDGGAFETLARKAGYALRSVLGGAPVWLTLVVLVAAGVLLFARSRRTPPWFAATEDAWPLVRPTVLALWITCVAGSLVNDFGLRIAAVALVAALPLLTLAALHAQWPGAPDTSRDRG